MEEVDRIIFRMLHQVDASIDINGKLVEFTPEKLIHVVSTCLVRINNSVFSFLKDLPAALTQRYSIATSLAESCKAVGYTNEIGYNTFLYPNTNEIRRLLMFLIEKLPREYTTDLDQANGGGEVERIISDALTDLGRTHNALIKNYGHMATAQPGARRPNSKRQEPINHTSNISKAPAERNHNENSIAPAISLTLKEENAEFLEAIENEKQHVNELSEQISILISNYKDQEESLALLRREGKEAQTELEDVVSVARRYERTAKVLENREANIMKLKNSITNMKEKGELITKRYEELQAEVNERKETVSNQLKEDASCVFAQKIEMEKLEAQLENLNEVALKLKRIIDGHTLDVPIRKVYIERLHEIMKNLGKQQKDIDDVLGKSLELQKVYNNIGAQVDRQFNYTEDLIYRNALHSSHAKKSYRLLAEVHNHCKQLEDLVTSSGALCKEVRDLEEQIEKERLKDVARSMRQINLDVEQSESLIQELQKELKTLESLN